LNAGFKEADGVTPAERHQIVDDWTLIKSEWMLIRDNSVQRFEFSVRLFSGHELATLLREVGFSEVTLCGDLDGRPYAPGARRLIAVARKA
jgi:hypothetical protein